MPKGSAKVRLEGTTAAFGDDERDGDSFLLTSNLF